MIYNALMEVIKTDEFVAWFEKLRDPKARAAIVSRIDRIEVLGNFATTRL